MQAPKNPFREKLAEGRTLRGCWLGLADAYAASVAATAGFDWVVIDGEHAPNDLRSTLAQLLALQGSGTAPVVRIPDQDTARIKQVLDLGAQTLLVPMVDTPEQATEIARACRYPPDGVRGVGAIMARASSWGLIDEYTPTANDQVFLMVQVETVKGVARLPEILAVEGVDGVFIGPFDLGTDMGRPKAAADPEVRRAVLDALKVIVDSGKVAGVIALDQAFAEDCAAAGARFLGVGIDVLVLANGLRALARG